MTEQDEAKPSHEVIAARAYQLYLARGEHGFDVEDWLQAEADLAAHPITTAHEEAEMRGAEAEAVEEKREADEAELHENPLLTDIGQSLSPERPTPQ